MMRFRISQKQAAQILWTCNPLGLIDSNKNLKIYENPVKCYYDAIIKLYLLAPQGWLDIPYFMMKYQGIRIAQARELCGRKQYGRLDWHCRPMGGVHKERNRVLKGVIFALLKVTDCEFSENAFNAAVYDFDLYNNKHDAYTKIKLPNKKEDTK